MPQPRLDWCFIRLFADRGLRVVETDQQLQSVDLALLLCQLFLLFFDQVLLFLNGFDGHRHQSDIVETFGFVRIFVCGDQFRQQRLDLLRDRPSCRAWSGLSFQFHVTGRSCNTSRRP
jgi:hypothetical protein